MIVLLTSSADIYYTHSASRRFFATSSVVQGFLLVQCYWSRWESAYHPPPCSSSWSTVVCVIGSTAELSRLGWRMAPTAVSLGVLRSVQDVVAAVLLFTLL